MYEADTLTEKINKNKLLSLSSSERAEGIESLKSRSEYMELELALLNAIYPDLESQVPIKIKDTKSYRHIDNLDGEVFDQVLKASLKSWKDKDENPESSIPFSAYFENLYKKRLMSNEKDYQFGICAYSDRDYRIYSDLKKLMNSGYQREDAINSLKKDRYSSVRETTWNTVRRLAEGEATAVSLDASIDSEDGACTLSDIIGAESSEIESFFESESIENFMKAVYHLIDPIENKIKKRIRMQDCCTFFMLKGLKLNDGQPYTEKPACNCEIFDAYKQYETKLMHDVFSSGLIKAKIEEELPLTELDGIGYNFLIEGVRFRKSELQEYWGLNNPSQVSRIISDFETPFKQLFKIK